MEPKFLAGLGLSLRAYPEFRVITALNLFLSDFVLMSALTMDPTNKANLELSSNCFTKSSSAGNSTSGRFLLTW